MTAMYQIADTEADTPQKSHGDYTLFVLDGDYLLPRLVRLGECNYDYIEVISGLEVGEQVVVSDMTKYKGKEKLKVERAE